MKTAPIFLVSEIPDDEIIQLSRIQELRMGLSVAVFTLVHIPPKLMNQFFSLVQNYDLLNPSMKTNLRRFCALFPWTFEVGSESYKQGGLNMATELRGLGGQAWLDRENRYTSLRDIMPLKKRKHSLLTFSEINEPAFWRNDSYDEYGRTPKTPLLGSAAHLWLQSSVADRNQQQGNIFTRCWVRLTRPQASVVSPPLTPPRNTFRFTFADCVGYCPLLRYLDLSHAFSALLNRLRQPQAFVSLRQ